MDDAGVSLFDRALRIVERRTPELADHYLQVPLSYYSDPEFDARERRLFMTQPRALVAASEIAGPNDFHVRTSMGRSILLTRDEDGRAHAFLNACRHRGAQPASGCGTAARHVCPYHGWNYSSKGELVAMPLPDRNASLDYSTRGLVELPSEERHGLIWVVLTPGGAIDVAAHLGELDAEFATLGMDRMTYHGSLPYEPLAANWKCVAEGLVEGLHTPFVHAATFNTNPQALGVDLAAYDRFGLHLRYSLPMFGVKEVASLRSLPAERRDLSRAVARCWFVSPAMLICEELYGLIFGSLEPGPTIDSAFMRYGWLSPVETAPDGLPSPQEMAARDAQAVREDAPVWASCGRGLSLGLHDAALVGRNEKGVQLFHQILAEQTGYGGLRYVDT